MERASALALILILSATLAGSAMAGLSVSVTSQRTVMDAGQVSNVSANVTGGTGSYTCLWSWYKFTSGAGSAAPFGGTSCNSVFVGNSSDLASPDVVQVNVNDSAGNTTSGSAFVAVKPGMTFALSAESNTTIYVGGSVTFFNSTTGGSLRYSWSYLSPGPGVVENGNQFTFNQTGTYNVTEVATDTNGESVSSTVQVTVLPIPTTTTTSVSTTTTSTSSSSSTSLSTSISTSTSVATSVSTSVTTTIPVTTTTSSTSTTTLSTSSTSTATSTSSLSTTSTSTSTSTSTLSTTSTSTSIATTTIAQQTNSFACKGPSTNLTITNANYEQYNWLSYSHSGTSVNIKKQTLLPINIFLSGSGSCLYVNSSGGDIYIGSSGSSDKVSASSKAQGNLVVAEGGSSSTMQFAMGMGVDTIIMGGSSTTLNAANPGGDIFVTSGGSSDTMNLATQKGGYISVYSAGSSDNVSTTGGTSDQFYAGSHNLVSLTNELVKTLTCTGNHNTVSTKNSSILYNRCS